MKKQVNIQQWSQLTPEQQAKFSHYPVSIGDMIEFLGKIDVDGDENEWIIHIPDLNYRSFKSEELVDALWEAVKYKLNNNL